MIRFLIVTLLSLSVSACVSPSSTFSTRAERLGLEANTIEGGIFQHRAFWNEGARTMSAQRTGKHAVETPRILHVYLGGDGVPWKGGNPTNDPTSRNPLMLQLISIDPMPAVFLGRPCFHGFSNTAPCRWAYWNDARYAEPVVASLTEALTRVAHQAGADKVVLFGGSGGGALAVLISDRTDLVQGIVTVAANLDTQAWTKHVGYDGLHESLNPATDGRKNKERNARVFERHYAGGKDKTVPPHTTLRGLRRQDELVVVPHFDHNCCWNEIWPSVLDEVAKLEGNPAAATTAPKPVQPFPPAASEEGSFFTKIKSLF